MVKRVEPRDEFHRIQELAPKYLAVLREYGEAEKALNELKPVEEPFMFENDAAVFQHETRVKEYQLAEFDRREVLVRLREQLNLLGQQLAEVIRYAGVWYRVPNGYIRQKMYRGWEFEYKSDFEIFKEFVLREKVNNGCDEDF